MLRKILGNAARFPGRLNAFVIIDIHIQVRAVLLGKRDALVVSQSRVLHGNHFYEVVPL
jgi:hypothetical protein